MAFDENGPETREGIEISARFRRLIEERIERLERDADADEAELANLYNSDHIRRQKRLVAVQRAEARRMRLFVDHSGSRIPPPMISL